MLNCGIACIFACIFACKVVMDEHTIDCNPYLKGEHYGPHRRLSHINSALQCSTSEVMLNCGIACIFACKVVMDEHMIAFSPYLKGEHYGPHRHPNIHVNSALFIPN